MATQEIIFEDIPGEGTTLQRGIYYFKMFHPTIQRFFVWMLEKWLILTGKVS